MTDSPVLAAVRLQQGIGWVHLVLVIQPICDEVMALETHAGVLNMAYECANQICRSLHHYCFFDSLAVADFTGFLTALALAFFEESGAS